VLLLDTKKRRYLLTLTEGKEFHSHSGIVAHDVVIGSEEGSAFRSSHGMTYVAIRPTLADFVFKMPRGAQVIYPKDLGALLMLADIFPGARVLESGVGSGALSMTMLDRVLGMLARRMRWMARSVKKRWQPLVTPRLVGFAIVVLALLLALPLPIPGSNLVFIVPLLIYAVGLLEGDGAWILVAHVATLVDIMLVFAFGATVLALLSRVWHWMV